MLLYPISQIAHHSKQRQQTHGQKVTVTTAEIWRRNLFLCSQQNKILDMPMCKHTHTHFICNHKHSVNTTAL